MTKEERFERAIKRAHSALWHVRALNNDDDGNKYRNVIRHLTLALNKFVEIHEETFEGSKI